MATLRVPTDFATIQDAVLAANSGDTIIVEAGFVSNAPATITKNDLTITGNTTTAGIVLTMALGIDTIHLTGITPFQVAGSNGNDTVHGNDGSNTITGAYGSDVIHGGNGNDAIALEYDGGEAYGDAGNDTLTGTSVTDRLEGGEGADSLSGLGGDDLLFDGDPTHEAAPANDTMSGGDGDDVIASFAGADVIDGGASINGDRAEIDRQSSTSNLSLIMTSPAVVTALVGDGTTIVNVEHLTVETGSGNDTLGGAGGNDIFRGGAGNDNLFGGAGQDELWGGAGNDVLDVGEDGGSAYGEAGDDILVAGDTNFSSLEGGAGNDMIHGGATWSFYDGGADNDLIIMGSGGGEATGGSGNDVLTGSESGEALAGGDGDDLVNGAGGMDWIIDSNLFHFLPSDMGKDTLNGGDDDDTIDSRAGIDAIDGGADGAMGDQAWISRTYQTVNLAFNFISPSQITTLTGDGTTVVNVERFTLEGGSGSDSFTTGALSDGLYGNAGNDTLNGGDGSDYLSGGTGNDSLNGGDGTDTASYFGAAAGVAIDLQIAGPQNLGGQGFDTLVSIENLDGTEHNDSLYGTSDGNVLSGGSGNDILDGRGGADTMYGAYGNDTFYVDDANDNISDYSGMGYDRVFTSVNFAIGAGLEIEVVSMTGTVAATGGTLLGNEFANELIGGLGNDHLNGGSGNDTLRGGAGNDTLVGSLSDIDAVDFSRDASQGATHGVQVNLSGNFVQGGIAVNTAIDAFGNTDSVTGVANVIATQFSDVLHGEQRSNLLDAGAGNDYLSGYGGNDTLLGGDGNDTLLGGDDNDTLDGGNHNDVMDGGWGNDTLRGGSGVDSLTGWDGNDVLYGDEGKDILNGGVGSDKLYGGSGDDTYNDVGAGDIVTEQLNEGYDTVNCMLNTYVLPANVERVNFIGAGNFVALGNSGNNRFTGSAGDDRFVDVYGGNDIVSGGSGTDSMDFRSSGTGVILDFITNVHGGAAVGDAYASIEKYFGSNSAADEMTGSGAGRFVFAGGGGNDTLRGSSNIDQLLGQAGNDLLIGNGGTDYLDGGAGDDNMIGGSGARDYFIYAAAGFGQDVILDFEDKLDRLKVHSSVANDVTDFSITGNGSSALLLTLVSDPSQTITIHSVSAVTITNADFIFY